MNLAIQDFKESILYFKFWGYLGWSDIKQRYRGSMIGPFWVTLNMAFFVVALGAVYSKLFHQDIKSLIPFLTASLLIWTFITTIVTESCDVFVTEKELIENVKLPYYTYVFKLIWRNFIIMLHNFIVYVAMCLFFQINPGLHLLLFIPGFMIISIGLIGLCTLLGLIGLRYRDIPPIINSLITVAFLVSPVTWKPEMLGNSLILKLNPITYFMDILRTPLLGSSPAAVSYIVCTLISIGVLLFANKLFSKYSSRIAFWV